MNFCESSSNSYYYYDYYYREDKGDSRRIPHHVAPTDAELERDSEQADASSFYDTGFINMPSNWDNAPDLDGEMGGVGEQELEPAPNRRRPRFATGTPTASKYASPSDTLTISRDSFNNRKVDADS
jgi:hypothetical protein